MKLSQIYYDSCMDEKATDEKVRFFLFSRKTNLFFEGLVPLMSLISHLGGWQLLTNAKFEDKDYRWETVAGSFMILKIKIDSFRIFQSLENVYFRTG